MPYLHRSCLSLPAVPVSVRRAQRFKWNLLSAVSRSLRRSTRWRKLLVQLVKVRSPNDPHLVTVSPQIASVRLVTVRWITLTRLHLKPPPFANLLVMERKSVVVRRAVVGLQQPLTPDYDDVRKSPSVGSV